MSDETKDLPEEKVGIPAEKIADPVEKVDQPAVSVATPDEKVDPPNEKVDPPVVKAKSRPVRRAEHAVSGALKDNVILSKCVFKNQWQRKSLTVHHVQRRLGELGFTSGLDDRDGWYGELTQSAVASFQKKMGIVGDGMMDAATFKALFDGDENVIVNV